ncbi:uncharacterized protein [Amphiura filiformis]|uniref:uncharacterized protein n=1 Tax=Amphiura filiformis TaxID=82378 RepID=UPI003B226C69
MLSKMATLIILCVFMFLVSRDVTNAIKPSPLVVVPIPPEEAPSAICCNMPLQCDHSCNPPAWHYRSTKIPLCYCDSVCELFGDCCLNFKHVDTCQMSTTPKNLGSGSKTTMSFKPSASGLDSTDPELTTSPEVLPSHVPSLSSPLIESMTYQDEDDGGGQSPNSIAEYSSFNSDYSFDMVNAELEFAMMQGCVVTSYHHTYEETNYTMNIGAYMVSMCPRKSEILLDHRERCESFNNVLDFGASFHDIETEFADFLPVTDMTDRRVHYRNMYCASCNGVSIENMIPWKLAYLLIDSPNIPYWFQPLHENMTRRCFANSLSRRPSLLKGIPLADLCNVVIEYDEQATGCIACLRKDLDLGKGVCKMPPSPIEEALAIPFDFRSYASRAGFRSTHDILCTDGFYFSQMKKKCLPKEDLIKIPPPCGQLELIRSSYLIKISFTAKNSSTTSLELINMFSSHMMYTRNQIRHETIMPTDMASTDNMKGMSQRCKRATDKTACDDGITTLLQFEVVSLVPEGFNNVTRDLLDQLPYALLNVSTEIHWIEYLQPCGSFSPLDCQGDAFNSNVVSFMKVNNTFLTDSKTSGNKMYVTERLMSKVIYRMQDDSNMQLQILIQDQVILCNGKVVLKCPSLLVVESNYIINEVNQNLRIISTGEIVSSDRYIVHDNKTASVCVDMGDGVWKQLSNVMFYVYIIGTSISLFALLLTFLTYCALSALRTVPGIATMNFIVASFVAQFGLLIGGNRIENTPIELCTFFAITLHYVWLASFFWTTALAFDVSRTLGTGMQPGGGGKGKKLFLYSIFSWGGPLSIIFPSLVFHFCDCKRGACCTSVSFTYGTDEVCWIRPQTSNLVAFGVPVMASLVFNIALFSRTVSGVRSSKRATSMIERRRVSVVQRAVNEFTIYIKVSMLMGFSWIWGFLFGFTGITALWTIFVIFNSVQGMFIFWAFACTSRVWGLLKLRFRSPSSSRHTPSPNDYLGTESQTKTKRISVFSVKT